MSKLTDWLYQSNLSHSYKLLIAIVVVVIVILFGTTGTWYYFHYKAQQEEQQRLENARRQAMELQNKRNDIHNFYKNNLTGMDVAGFLRLYKAIVQSRYPIELAGFTETHFLCDTNNCEFSYKPTDSAIFNVQQKTFEGKQYTASFSQDSIDYKDIPSNAADNPLLELFNQQKPINEPDCNSILNYIYGFNSLVQPDDRFTLTNLPASSVEDDEQALPGNPEDYGLLAGNFELHLTDNYADVNAFWQHQAFKSAFIITSVEKKDDTLDINGTFLCKK